MRRTFQHVITLCLVVLFAFGSAAAPAQDEFLDPDAAFGFSARLIDQGHVEVSWRSAPGYYLYRDKIKLSVSPDTVKLADFQLPQGTWHEDETFGRQQVYKGTTIKLTVPLQYSGAKPDKITVTSKYQGCAEAGVCYPPTTKDVSLTLSGAATGGGATSQAAPAAGAPAAPASEQDRFAQILQGSLWVTVGLFFLAGLALALTPCVFPMIPILSAIIVGQGQSVSTGRAFGLSLAYVLGMALTYTVVGMIAGVTGAYLQAFFQNPWVLATFSLVFVLLALSMFGFYNLQMPAGIQAKLSSAGKGGNLAGTFIMGVLSALIVGPCVAAPLAGALLYISQTGDVALGGVSLFALSLGMGAPLLAIGASAGQLLPRAGAWMDAVKHFFGVLLLAVAIWMLSRILPAWATMALWAALLIISAVYLRVLDSLPESASGWARLGKGIGVLLLGYGLLLGLGAATGAQDPLRPLSGLSFGTAGGTPQAAEASALNFRDVKTAQDLQQALAAAQGKPVLLDFYADWCVECVRLERTTFQDPQVQQALGSFVLLRADVTDNTAEQRALLRQFQLIGPPAILFFDPNGQEVRASRLVGYKDASEFLTHLRGVTASTPATS
ncbi:MAG: protein-disulfide reductase DsbD [Pseudomonadota bacterium]